MIKRLAKCVREFKKDAILTPVYVSLEVLTEVVIPILMAMLIDNGIKKGDLNYIVLMAGALVLACLVSLAFGILAGRSAAVASCGFAKNLRSDMYANVQRFSFSSIDKFSTASIITRLTTDVANVQNAFGMVIRIAFRAPLMLIYSLIVAFVINTQLALIFLAAVPVLAIAMFVIVRKAYPVFTSVFKTYDKLNGVVQENLQGIRVVKSFVREEHEDEKFTGVSKLIYNLFSKAEKLVSWNNPIMMTCIYTIMLLVAWFGASIIVSTGEAAMTTGELTSMITYAMQMMMSLMMVSMIFVMLLISRASAERINEVLSEQSDIESKPGAVKTIPDGRIDFNDVCFRYAKTADKNTLDHINLHIRSGMTVGIMGGTGSAKSSLVQLIPRLYDVFEGSVMLGGRDVREYDLTALRDSVAMVLQKNELFSGTVKENLRWGNENATDEEIAEACELAQASSFISEMPAGYDTYIERGGTNVSGGQKQRLCIARALLKHPKVLILDDSTSAVDTHTDALIRRGFESFIPETTKLIITQRVASVQDADMIVILDDGRIVDCGTHDELLSRNEIYKEVYYSQTKGDED